MLIERVNLYYQQGVPTRCIIRNSKTLRPSGPSTRSGAAVKANGVTYEEPKRVFDRVVREKTGKGYRGAETNGDAATPAISLGMPTKEFSGHAPELLTPIEERETRDLVPNLSWWFQQKFDGRRLAVQKQNGQYSGINKIGQIVPIDAQLAASLGHVQADSFLVDGEIIDSKFYTWDLLSVNDTDLRIQPYEVR